MNRLHDGSTCHFKEFNGLIISVSKLQFLFVTHVSLALQNFENCNKFLNSFCKLCKSFSTYYLCFDHDHKRAQYLLEQYILNIYLLT